jgi:RNA polymerase sigma-70 factor (ECF subfamily)
MDNEVQHSSTLDPAELSRWVDEYSPAIYRLALKITADPKDAEDVLQDTFLKAIQGWKGFEGRSQVSTWLYRIAVNEALMLVRKRKKVVVSIDDDPDDNEDAPHPVELADWDQLPETELLSAEGKQFLGEALDTLPEKLRLVFILRDVQGLSIKETMDALNLSETAVKTRLLRARLKLREELTGYYHEKVSSLPSGE